MDSPLWRITSWTSGGDHPIAGFEGIGHHAARTQSGWAGQPGPESLRRAFGVFGHHMHPRSRAAVVELHQLAFNRDCLFLEIVRGKRMVGGGRNTGCNSGAEQGE